jgi:hypothetical protein
MNCSNNFDNDCHNFPNDIEYSKYILGGMVILGFLAMPMYCMFKYCILSYCEIKRKTVVLVPGYIHTDSNSNRDSQTNISDIENTELPPAYKENNDVERLV